MKTLKSIFGTTASLGTFALALSSHAATLTWNGAAGGNWDTATTNWLDGVTPATWNNATPDSAVFGSTGAGTVNLTTGITAGGITFDTTGYTIAGNTLTLSSSTITANADATISSALAGTTGLTKAGTGKLTLGNTPGFTAGSTTINNGTLQFPYSAGFARPTAINSPGALTLTSTAQIVGSSSFTLSGSGPLTIGGTANTRMILQGTGSTSYTGDITIKTASILEPRSFFSSTSGNSVTVESGGELRIQFDPTSINGLNGAGVVQSVSGAATLTIGKGNGSGTFTGTLKNNGNTISLVKTGTGTQELSGSNIGNTALGGTTLTNGTLKLTQTTAWSSDVTMDNANTVTLQLNAPNSGDSWTYAKKILAGASASSMIEKVGSGTVVLNPAASSTFGGTAANAVQVTAGKLYVNAALNATAPKATVNGGTLGGKSSLGDTVVASGGTIEGGQAGTGTLTLGNLTYNGPGALTVSPAAAYVPVVVNNAPTVNGTVTVNIANSPALGATYHLMQFTGAPTGAGSFVLPLSRNPYSLAINGSYLDLVVGSTAVFPVWTGGQSSEWSLNSIAGSKNWKQNTDNAPTDFMSLDNVIFNDMATTTTPDLSVANVSPGSVTFNNSSKNYTLTGSFGIASGTLTKTGSGSLTINNVNTYSGATTLNNGTLSFVSGGLGGSAVTVTGNSTLQWLGGNSSSVPVTINSGVTATLDTGSNSITEATAIGGTGALVKTGTGTLSLVGSSALTGITTVSQGSLVLATAAAAGTGAVTLGDGYTGANPVQFTFGNAASDTGFTKDLTVAASGSGTATLKLADIGTAESGDGTITLNRAATLDGSALTSTYYLEKRALAGAGALTYAGAANPRLIMLTGSPLFTGDITVQSGVFEPRSALTSATGNSVTLGSGGTLQMRFGSATTINALNGDGIVECLNSGTLLTIGKSNGSGSFSGILRNNGAALSLTKTGTGKQVLTGESTYGGATTVSGGTLELNSPGSLANTLVTVQSGGTLAGSGGTISSSVNITSGGTLAVNTAVDSSAVVDTLTINTLSLNAGCTNFMRITKTGGTPASDLISGTSAAPLSFAGVLQVVNITSDATPLALGDTFTLYDGWSGYSGGFSSMILPTLPLGLSWDTSQLAVNGTISVANVAGAPQFSPSAGTYVGAQSVTLSSTTPGATIRYTINGSTPTSGSPVYTAPISVPVSATTMTIRAYSSKAGYTDSAVTSATYSVPEAAAIWISQSGDSWNLAENWSNSVIPNNVGAAVDFSQLTLTESKVVYLDSSPVVGKMVFGDQGNSYSWEIDNGGGGPLTLNDGASRPGITVLNQKTTIAANLAGGAGLDKLGAGTLVLSGANTYSGGTTISQGTLELVNVGSADSDPITLGGANTGTNDVKLIVDANIANHINVSTNGTGTATIEYAQTGTFQSPSVLTLNRPTTINVPNETGGAQLWGGIHGNVGTLTFNGPASGRINLEGQVVGGQYTFTGTVVLNSGILEAIGHGLGSANPLVMQNGTAFYIGDGYVVGDTTIGSLNGTATTSIQTIHDGGTFNNQVLSLGHDNGSGTFNGAIANGAVQLGLTKVGTGIQTLSGANTYTGATTVNGGTLALVGGSQASPITVNNAGTSLGFTLGSGTTSTSTVTFGAGTTVKITGTPTLASYTLMTASSIAGTPALSSPIAGYTLSVTGGNTLVLVAQSTGYSSWASGKGLDGSNNGALQDPNQNGISNLLEYIFNGEPLLGESPAAILPTLNASGSNFVFTFTRRVESAGDTTQIFEYGTNLSGWTPLNITAPTDGAVTLGTPTGGTPNLQTVTVTVAKGTNTKLFGRLKATQP